MSETMSPGKQASQTLALNMKLISHHEMGGFGGVGEGDARHVLSRRFARLQRKHAARTCSARIAEHLDGAECADGQHNSRAERRDLVIDLQRALRQPSAHRRFLRRAWRARA